MRLTFNTMLCILIFIILKSNQTTNDEKDCRCVSLFMCNDDTDTDYHDGSLLLRSTRRIVERKKDYCESALEICCQPEDIIPQMKEVSNKGCGIRNFDGIDYFTEGHDSYYEAKFGEFPWTIAVLHNRPDKQDEYICDGALIHRKIVLTAAHCVDGKPTSKIKIRAGEWDTQSVDESLPHQDRAIENILYHRNYSSRLFHNDIALLLLSRSLEITENVNVICLPESMNEFEASECVASGWSPSKLDGRYGRYLKKMELEIIPRANCQTALQRGRLKNKCIHDDSFICANEMFGNNMWKGDGGSPFVCPLKIDSHRYVQVGVAVRNIGRSIGIPNIFANILHVRSWIDQQLLFYNLDNTEYQYGKNAYEYHDYF